ncbi:MAG: hypothetical protein AABY07_06775, partial [Nanoarchaeota archaeon]
MSYYILTESHGEIESGFYGIFTQFTRVGEYAFTTKYFCEFVKKIADDPKLRQLNILAYGLDKYFERRKQ